MLKASLKLSSEASLLDSDCSAANSRASARVYTCSSDKDGDRGDSSGES